jgi:mono/diheme cytochrome c family protein
MNAFQRRGCLVALLGTLVFGSSGVRAESLTASPGSLERGRYLVDAGNCYSCHTRPGQPDFSGGVAFDTPAGVIYSTNITPDVATGIGRWTLIDLRRAMQEGVAPDGRHLFPAFPYPSFTKVTDADIADIYAYLRTLRPVRRSPAANGRLFAMRWPMAAWNALFFKPSRYSPRADQTPEWNRGAYLVEGLLHCGACHSPRSRLLAEIPDRALEGGELRAEVGNGRVRPWSAVDLSSGERGLKSWSVTDLAKYLKTGVCARGGTFGPMNEVILRSTSRLTDEDLRAVAVYLKSHPSRPSEPEPQAASANRTGEALYKDRCAKCHGPSGRGGMFSGPPVAGSAIVQSRNPASLLNVILFGPSLAKGVTYGAWETMPAYADILTDAGAAALANYLRNTWGNHGPALTAADVQKQR